MEYYPYKYFSGANVTVEIGNEKAFQCAGISFMVNESNQPVYGYASTLYDAVIPGRRIIQGSFVVNFVGEDIKVLNDMRNLGESFYHNQPLFDIKINYGIGSQNKTNYLLSGCFFISQGQTIQVSENVILEEFSFIARDVKTFRETSAQIIENLELPESKPVNAKSVDFSNNIYEYKLFDPRKNNKEIVSVSLSQDNINDIFISDDDGINFDGQPGNMNENLKDVFESVSDGNFGSIEEIKSSLDEINFRTYPESFYKIVRDFAKYIDSDNSLDEFIGASHKLKNHLLHGHPLYQIYGTATLTWINKTTGSN